MLTNKLISKNIDLSKNMFIAYSGGPDSTALLHLLSTVDLNEKAKVQAIHINHNLSKHSDSWERHCIEQCSKLNINLITESVEIKSDGDGIEAASRKARYKIFENLLNDDDQLLLGHHRDDVAETIFMRLLRGSGPDGMEGPKIKRSIGKGILIRPFLKNSKQEILEYLNQNEVEFIQDDSNLSNDFDRNFLRNRIFPLLEERWNNFPERINNFSSILSSRNDNYMNLIHGKYQHLIGNSINLKELKELPDTIISDVLRYSIKKSNIAIPSIKIMKEIKKTFIHSNPGPKSKVCWSRADKEEVAGKITYANGCILISKNN